MQRVAKVALVASGGAARGIAHLGVLRACHDLGISPQIFVGTASGALVLAAYAQGIALDVMLDSYRLAWRRRHRGPRMGARTFMGLPTLAQWLDPGYLLSGVFSLDRLERYLREQFPVNDFRKLPVPLLITATDLDRAQRVVFGTGYDDAVPISEAVAASCCLPALFRPYRIGNAFLVSGEVVRTLSADLALNAGAEVVIVSDVYRPWRPRQPLRSIGRQGLLRVVRQTVNITLTQKEQTGLELHATRHPHARFVTIAPDIGMVGYFSRLQVRKLMLRSYRTALRQLTQAKRQGLFGPVGVVEPHSINDRAP